MGERRYSSFKVNFFSGPIITGSVQLCYKNKAMEREKEKENCLESCFVCGFLFTEICLHHSLLHEIKDSELNKLEVITK